MPRTPPRYAPATDPRSWPPCGTWASPSSNSPARRTSPRPAAATPGMPPAYWPHSDSVHHDQNGHHTAMRAPCRLAAHVPLAFRDMAPQPRLITAQDLIVAADFGQIYI